MASSSNSSDANATSTSISCPRCNKMAKPDCTHDLDAEDVTEYSAVVKIVEHLCLKEAETMERLSKKEVIENVETVDRRVNSEQLELMRQDLKQITDNEIKTILLGPNKDLLEKQFGQLKWDHLSHSFQNELWEKIPPKFRTLQFNKPVSISSNTLIHLIKSSPNDEELLLKLLEDYCDQQRKLNGSVTWNDFTKLFNQDLLLRLREKCGLPSLELDKIPLTPKIIVTLMRDEEDDTESGATLLAKVVELFIENLSDIEIKFICRTALLQLIPCTFHPKLELETYFNADQVDLVRLVRNGILKMNGGIEFVHESVETFFYGMLKKKFIVFNHPGDNPLDDYFLNYFQDKPSDFSLKLINFNDAKILDLFMIFIMMISDIICKRFLQRQSSAYRKHLLGMEFPCIIKSSFIKLTLVHVAALKGDFHQVQFLLFALNFSLVLDQPRFQGLVQTCALVTSDESIEQIEERKKIIVTVLNCSKNVAAKAHALTRLTNVHIELLKFLVELGPEVHEKIWSEKQMLLEAAEYLGPDEFHDIAKWLLEKGHSTMLKKRNGAGASPLHLAIRRINVKPETIQLFRKKGVSLNDKKTHKKKEEVRKLGHASISK